MITGIQQTLDGDVQRFCGVGSEDHVIGTFAAEEFSQLPAGIIDGTAGFQGGAVSTTAAIAHGIQFLIHYGAVKRMGGFPFSLRELLPGTVLFLAVDLFAAMTAGWWPLRWGIAAVLGAWELFRIVRRKRIF